MPVGHDPTSRLLERGLQASALRHSVLVNNIANMETPGFKRSRVEFERQLTAALETGKDPATVQPAVVVEQDRSASPDGNNVDVEAEMARLAENQLWYAALTRQLSDHFSRLRMAIHDGRS